MFNRNTTNKERVGKIGSSIEIKNIRTTEKEIQVKLMEFERYVVIKIN